MTWMLIVLMGLLCLWTIEMTLLEGKNATRWLARFNRWLAVRNARRSAHNAVLAKKLSSDAFEAERKALEIDHRLRGRRGAGCDHES